MVNTFREKLIARKYSTSWDVVQALLTVSANTTITVAITPPAGKVFMVSEIEVGQQVISALLSAIIYVDGTQWFSGVSNSSLRGHFPNDTPQMYSIHQIQVVITNADTIPHTTDFQFSGFLIEIPLLEKFIQEMTGDEDRRILLDVLGELRKLNAKIH